MFDQIEKFGKSIIQHGPNNDRAYLVNLHPDDLPLVLNRLYDLAIAKRYTKIFVRVYEWAIDTFLEDGYKVETSIPDFQNGELRVYFMAKFFGAKRSFVYEGERILEALVKKLAMDVAKADPIEMPERYHIRKLREADASDLTALYRAIFTFYPSPITKKEYIRESMQSNIQYFGVFEGKELVATSSVELELSSENAEMTGFATATGHGGNHLSYFLLQEMESQIGQMGIKTLYTMAKANSHGMNRTFGRANYRFGGILINNTLIGEKIENMNVWYKNLTGGK